MKHILFVCTGNTCRSPLAEALFRQLASTAGLEVKVRSAGVAAFPGLAASEYVQKILHEKAIDGSCHQSQPVTWERVQWADLILTMTHSHRQQLIQQFPEAVGKGSLYLNRGR